MASLYGLCHPSAVASYSSKTKSRAFLHECALFDIVTVVQRKPNPKL